MPDAGTGVSPIFCVARRRVLRAEEPSFFLLVAAGPGGLLRPSGRNLRDLTAAARSAAPASEVERASNGTCRVPTGRVRGVRPVVAVRKRDTLVGESKSQLEESDEAID